MIPLYPVVMASTDVQEFSATANFLSTEILVNLLAFPVQMGNSVGLLVEVVCGSI